MEHVDLLTRIKEELIINNNDVPKYKWQKLGYLDVATTEGITGDDFFRSVGEAGYQLMDSQAQINNLKKIIVTCAQADNNELTPLSWKKIHEASDRLHLSRSFVEDRWVPLLIETLLPLPSIQTEAKQETCLAEIETGNIPIKHTLIETEAIVDSAIELSSVIDDESEPVSIKIDKNRFSSFNTLFYSFLVMSILVGAYFFWYNKKPNRSVVNTQKKELIRQEVIRLIDEGVKLAEKGDHVEADLKFSQAVKNSQLYDLDFQRLEVQAASFNEKGDALCDGSKDEQITELSNEYYRHAAILSQSEKSRTCQ